MNEQPFTCTLNTAAQHQLGYPILMTFEIRNTSNKTYQFLRWGTPLDPNVTNFLNLKRAGETVNYEGFLIRRGDPLDVGYAVIGPGQSLTAEVDISLLYLIDQPGSYTATLKIALHDAFLISGNTKQPPRPGNDHQYHNLDPTTVEFEVLPGGLPRQTLSQARRQDASASSIDNGVEPVLDGGLPSDRSDTFVAHFITQIIAAMSARLLKIPNSNTNRLYREWFGEFDQTRYNIVMRNYTTIAEILATEKVTYDLRGAHSCDPDEYASTDFFGRTVYLCERFLECAQFGDDPKFATLIHEWSQAFCFTDDIRYQKGPCRQLACTLPLLACLNADNYAYFAEDVAKLGGQIINSVPDSTTKEIAACVFNEKIFVFWKASTFNQIVGSASTDGQLWPPGQVINNGNTSSAPAACVFNKKLYLFWRDSPSDAIFFSVSADGQTWPMGTAINAVDQTSTGPVACMFKKLCPKSASRSRLFVQIEFPSEKSVYLTKTTGSKNSCRSVIGLAAKCVILSSNPSQLSLTRWWWSR